MSGVLGLLVIGLLAAVLIAILVVGYLVVTRVVRRRHDATANSEQNVSAIARVELDEAHRQAGDIRQRAETEAADVRTKAQTIADQAQQARREAEEEARQLKEDLRELRLDLERREHRLAEREERAHTDQAQVEERARELDLQENEIAQKRAELLDIEEDRRLILERISGLTADRAKAEIVATIENQAKRDAAIIVRDIEAEAREQADEREVVPVR